MTQGGIVGRMDLGQVSHCENYGSVSSADGSYEEASLVRLGEASGTVGLAARQETTMGGIAGYGSTLKNCHTHHPPRGERLCGHRS